MFSSLGTLRSLELADADLLPHTSLAPLLGHCCWSVGGVFALCSTSLSPWVTVRSFLAEWWAEFILCMLVTVSLARETHRLPQVVTGMGAKHVATWIPLGRCKVVIR